jgi:hypothetical protein
VLVRYWQRLLDALSLLTQNGLVRSFNRVATHGKMLGACLLDYLSFRVSEIANAPGYRTPGQWLMELQGTSSSLRLVTS